MRTWARKAAIKARNILQDFVTSSLGRQPGLSARSKAFSPIQNNSDLAQGPLRLRWGIIPGSPIKVTPAICGGRAEMEGAKQKD
jgi:hypothetical protein